jgi:hypothetical protein
MLYFYNREVNLLTIDQVTIIINGVGNIEVNKWVK